MFWELESYENIIANQINTYGHASRDTVKKYFSTLVHYYTECNQVTQEFVAYTGHLQDYLTSKDPDVYKRKTLFIDMWVLAIIMECKSTYIKIKDGPEEVPNELLDEFLTKLESVTFLY